MKKLPVSIAIVFFLFFSCKKDSLPEVTTKTISSIKTNSALSGGNVISDGGDIISARGICWSLKENPTIADGKTNDGTGSGVFESILSGLFPNTTYHARAYATNSLGTTYGSEVVFTTRNKNVLVTDGDSRTDGWNCSYKYPYWPLLSLEESFDIYNTAFGGLTTADLVSRAEDNVDPKLSISSRLNIVVFWAGVNDIAVQDLPASTAYNNLVSYCTARKAKGWKVIVCTEVSMKGIGSGGVCDSLRTLLNDSIRANWVEFADGIADLAGHKSIGYIGAYKDTSFFCDGIHLTNAGTVCVSEMISNAVNALIKNEVK